MSLQTTLKGCYEVLRESAVTHRANNRHHSAAQCDLQADAVLKYIDDETDLPTRKETGAIAMLLERTSRRNCHHCAHTIHVGEWIFWNGIKPYCSCECRGDYDYDDSPTRKETSDD